MPESQELSDDVLISQAHALRRKALQGDEKARRLASAYDVQVRSRLKQPVAHPREAPDVTQPAPVESAAREAAMSRYLVATADTTSDTSVRTLSELLRNVRQLLAMDIAFVSEFSKGRRVFRCVDAVDVERCGLRVGQSDPLEDTYCQRVVDGRLPLAIPDVAALAEASELAITRELNIGAYLSAPVTLPDGTIYGTLCCISHEARSALGNLQVDALRTVAELVSKEISRAWRGAESRPGQA